MQTFLIFKTFAQLISYICSFPHLNNCLDMGEFEPVRLALFSLPLTSCHCDFKTGTLGHNFKGILYSVLFRTLSIPPARRIQTQYTTKPIYLIAFPYATDFASTNHPEEDSTTPDKGVCVPETRKLLSVGSSKGSQAARMNPQALPDLVLYKAWH